MTQQVKISIVVPCHNEEAVLPTFFAALEEVAGSMIREHPGLAFEAVFVDDGSSDGTLATLRAWAHAHDAARRDPEGRRPTDDVPQIEVAWISLSRNFGKEAALYAGLARATGDVVATMDADMQDPPSLLPEMYNRLLADPELDNVATRRVTRAGEPPVRSWFARKFYRVINALSQTEIVDGARDYRLMRRQMVDAILSLGEHNRFSKGIFAWVGFNTEWIAYENTERAAGETNWSFWKLCVYALDGIVAFSTKPLTIASAAGIVLCLLALALVILIVVRWLLFGDPVAGWASTVCIITFIGGVQLMCLGIIGQYLAKTYVEAKHRPLYVVRRSSDLEPGKGARDKGAGGSDGGPCEGQGEGPVEGSGDAPDGGAAFRGPRSGNP